ncbi:CLUMA_CG005566, isoform A [Clunio marinus]|uniref:CLUMA_CG005566, isoform A n=1 Tax=Clunio marinus TaxID=568069 RepID=A0A1J1HWS2_9DIPT|nr:CLUMA_CG005566, isoform A [Clunio marinus]
MRKLLFDLIKKSESRLFGKYLLITNTVSSGFLMFIGEAAAQRINNYYSKENNGEFKYDNEKLKQLTVVGLSQGPLHHYTYLWMERLLPGNAKKTVFKKILADQFIVSPVFIVHYFYTAFFLAGSSFKDTVDILRKKFLTIYLADWMVWPPTQLINFFFVPLKYRVLYINMITTFYNVFLCYVKNKHEPEIENGREERS